MQIIIGQTILAIKSRAKYRRGTLYACNSFKQYRPTSADEWKPDTCSNPIEPHDQREAQTFGEPLLDTPMRSHRSTE
jgi:hypothetical protein